MVAVASNFGSLGQSEGGHIPDLAPGTSMEDLQPPVTFLISLDAPMYACATNGAEFFGSGGVLNPSGPSQKLTVMRVALAR